MSASKYVSAEWIEPTIEGGQRMIKAIGDDTLEYWIPGDDPEKYDVPPFPAFRESPAGKTFMASYKKEGS
jgi:hypothetical protein